MDFLIDDFPTLTPYEIHNQSTPNKNDFSDDSIDQSPAVTSNHNYKSHSKDHAKSVPIVKIISTIQHSSENNAAAPYLSAESYTATASATSTNYKI